MKDKLLYKKRRKLYKLFGVDGLVNPEIDGPSSIEMKRLELLCKYHKKLKYFEERE